MRILRTALAALALVVLLIVPADAHTHGSQYPNIKAFEPIWDTFAGRNRTVCQYGEYRDACETQRRVVKVTAQFRKWQGDHWSEKRNISDEVEKFCDQERFNGELHCADATTALALNVSCNGYIYQGHEQFQYRTRAKGGYKVSGVWLWTDYYHSTWVNGSDCEPP